MASWDAVRGNRTEPDRGRAHPNRAWRTLVIQRAVCLTQRMCGFFTAPAYDGWPLVMLRLDEVDVDQLAELVTVAWRMLAPS